IYVISLSLSTCFLLILISFDICAPKIKLFLFYNSRTYLPLILMLWLILMTKIHREIQSYPRTLLWYKSTDCCSWDEASFIPIVASCNSSISKDFSWHIIISLNPSFHLNLVSLIPSKISHLFKLYVLCISIDYPYRLRLKPHNFEPLLKNLTQLSSTLSLLTSLLASSEFLFLFNKSMASTLLLGFPQPNASLMKLCLSSVNFTGVPDSFSHQTSLHDLDMSDCDLSGHIPKPRWNLTNIEVLDFCNSHLERSIFYFLRFGKLRNLSVGNNTFNGQHEFLSFNRTQTQLEWLVFLSNYLIGPIQWRIYEGQWECHATPELRRKLYIYIGGSHGLWLWSSYWAVHNIHNVVNSMLNMV
ncbi:hypothetical protein H5410_003207, partial [Solanum commersonii]